MNKMNKIYVNQEAWTISYKPCTECVEINVTEEQIKEIEEMPSENIKETVRILIDKLLGLWEI